MFALYANIYEVFSIQIKCQKFDIQHEDDRSYPDNLINILSSGLNPAVYAAHYFSHYFYVAILIVKAHAAFYLFCSIKWFLALTKAECGRSLIILFFASALS